MRYFLSARILSIVIWLLSISQLAAIEVSVTTLNFFQEKPYLEIYSRIIGNTVQFESQGLSNDYLISNVELLVLLEKDGSLVTADKLNLMSPESAAISDFWDMRRYVLENGDYELSLRYVDLNNPSDTLHYEENISIHHTAGEISNSDILLMSAISGESDTFAFEKAGFYYEPLMYNLYGATDNVYVFYSELYNLPDDKGPLFYRYVLKDQETKEERMKPGYKKFDPKGPWQILEKFNIEDMLSGNYQLQLDVVDKEMMPIHTVTENFAIHHPVADYKSSIPKDGIYETSFVQMLDEGEINYALKAILPRVSGASSGLLTQLIWEKDIEPKRYFLYTFWSQFSANNSSEIYEKYMEVARAVDNEFHSNVGHGFESDRGYFFLKYGQPDDVVTVEDEPTAPPYEIWVYNYLEETHQTAVKFLFYNPSLVTNDFILLHSTCRGEISNPQWELELYSDDNLSRNQSDLDRTVVPDALNRNARRYFTDF